MFDIQKFDFIFWFIDFYFGDILFYKLENRWYDYLILYEEGINHRIKYLNGVLFTTILSWYCYFNNGTKD